MMILSLAACAALSMLACKKSADQTTDGGDIDGDVSDVPDGVCPGVDADGSQYICVPTGDECNYAHRAASEEYCDEYRFLCHNEGFRVCLTNMFHDHSLDGGGPDIGISTPLDGGGPDIGISAPLDGGGLDGDRVHADGGDGVCPGVDADGSQYICVRDGDECNYAHRAASQEYCDDYRFLCEDEGYRVCLTNMFHDHSLNPDGGTPDAS